VKSAPSPWDSRFFRGYNKVSYWIDVHTHLEMLENDPEKSIQEAESENVRQLVTIGCHPNDFDRITEIATKYFPKVCASLGVHPHEAKFYSDQIEEAIRQEAPKPYMIAVGEIGLDYYYDHSPREVQNSAFDRQIDLAQELGLPIEIHTRDAEDDTIKRLKKIAASPEKSRLKGMMHCFTGTQKLADAALEAGFYISCSGVVTFKTAEPLRDVIRSVPLNRLLVETDAPFLAPVPNRGKKNIPAWVALTGKYVADLKQITSEELQKQTIENAHRLFHKLPRLE
jgi:TatD DNase family protein